MQQSPIVILIHEKIEIPLDDVAGIGELLVHRILSYRRALLVIL